VTFYFDLTELLQDARNSPTITGIQRATLSLASSLVQTHGSERVKIIGHHPAFNEARVLSAAPLAGRSEYDQAQFLKHFDLEGSLALRSPAGGARERLARFASGLTGRRGAAAGSRSATEALAAGDVVFVIGAIWGMRGYLEYLYRMRRERGIRLVQFVHDLIPLVAAEHVDPALSERFSSWLAETAANADAFVVNSQSTRADLVAWQGGAGVQRPVRVVRLAHQFASSSREPEARGPWQPYPEITANVRSLLARPYALCVGTMESRKQNWLLANAWREVHCTLGLKTPRLVFAGRRGWLNESFDDFLAGTGNLYGFITIAERPSDVEVCRLFRSSLFTVYVSAKEGWGLPIGESLWLGRPVICSSGSSEPEVGGDLADYVDIKNPDTLVASIIKLATDVEYREGRARQIASARLRTWKDVADDLWTAVNESGPAG